MTISIRNSQVTTSAMIEAETEMFAFSWSVSTIQTGNVVTRLRLAIVNSPRQSATISTVDESSEVPRFGRITRHMVVGQLAPRLLDASVSVFRSMERSPASIAR